MPTASYQGQDVFSTWILSADAEVPWGLRQPRQCCCLMNMTAPLLLLQLKITVQHTAASSACNCKGQLCKTEEKITWPKRNTSWTCLSVLFPLENDWKKHFEYFISSHVHHWESKMVYWWHSKWRRKQENKPLVVKYHGISTSTK